MSRNKGKKKLLAFIFHDRDLQRFAQVLTGRGSDREGQWMGRAQKEGFERKGKGSERGGSWKGERAWK